jgi:hypothetical protein
LAAFQLDVEVDRGLGIKDEMLPSDWEFLAGDLGVEEARVRGGRHGWMDGFVEVEAVTAD